MANLPSEYHPRILRAIDQFYDLIWKNDATGGSIVSLHDDGAVRWKDIKNDNTGSK